jgi:hypothetical protein
MSRILTHGGVLNDCGVIYLVLDRPIFMQMCMLSMMSLRKSGYEGPIAVVTDLTADVSRDAAERLGQGLPANFQLISLDRNSEPHIPQKAYKATLDRLTPFRRTLYLDCDTIICRSIVRLWEGAADAELAFALDRAPTVGAVRRSAPTWGSAVDWEETIALCGAESAHHNSGVIYWSSSPLTSNVFALWEREIDKYRSTDQAPLARALHTLKCKPDKLNQKYNVQTGQARLYQPAVIRHFSGCNIDQTVFEMHGLYLKIHENPFAQMARSGADAGNGLLLTASKAAL